MSGFLDSEMFKLCINGCPIHNFVRFRYLEYTKHTSRSNTFNSCYSSNFSTGTVNYGQCNPHGIDTILNRRTAAAALNTLTSSNSNSSPPNSTSSSTNNCTSSNSTAPSVNPYFKLEDLHQAAAAAAQIANQRQNSNLYWPGIQGLISNPHIWRERFNGKNILNFEKRNYL